MRTTEPKTVIENTCCPVCGTGIASRSPRVELRPRDTSNGLAVVIRVDRGVCADRARRDPDRHLHAARINQVAH